MNMKYKNKYSTWFGATAMLLMISSCDGFLDKMPDNRTELDNNEKVLQLLVSAYSTGTYVQITELMSDNVADNGPLYISYNKSVEESYKWQDFTDNQQDTPQFIWNEYYKAIAAVPKAFAECGRRFPDAGRKDLQGGLCQPQRRTAAGHPVERSAAGCPCSGSAAPEG